MASILPDKILSDAQISKFVDRVNTGSKEIISDSKFEIPDPALPGIGMLIKLLIRSFEKSIASSLAPILIGKKTLEEGVSALDDFFETVKKIFTNPIQFVIDEGINSVLREFPFPIAFKIGSVGGDVNKLKELVDKAGDPRLGGEFQSSSLTFYNYDLVFSASEPPKSGEITTVSDSLSSIKEVTVSYTTKTNEQNKSLTNLKIQDRITISDGNDSAVFVITELSDGIGERKLILTKEFDQNESQKDIFVPGFSGIGNSSSFLLRDFITEDGSILIPLSVLGINLPLISSLNLSLGNFNVLPDDSPTKKYLAQLGQDSGLDFNQVFSGMITGKFPAVDFSKLQNDPSDAKEKAKEDMISFARLMQISIENPFFLIKIVGNYFRLLLLPINVLVGVLKGLAEKITSPIKLIKAIIQGITNPIKLICDLVSEAFLQFLDPYIRPVIEPIMPYQEALVDPNDKNRGIKPLFSDLICGKFKKGLASYEPNQDFFKEQSRLISSSSSGKNTVDLPYYIITDGAIPDVGQISVDNEDLSQIRSIKISNLTNTVENSTGVIAASPVNSTISLSVNESYYTYRINYKSLIQKENTSYFELLVSPTVTLVQSNNDLVKSGSNSDALKAVLTADNPNKTLLYIIEKYLPVKLVSVWESLKGIIAITASLAAEIPSLVPSVIKSVLSGNSNDSEIAESGANISDVSLGTENLLRIMFEGQKSLLYLASKPPELSPITSEQLTSYRNEVADIIQNSSTSTEDGIETPFFDMYDISTSQGINNYISRDNLSNISGGITADSTLIFNPIDIVGPLLDKEDFYYGQLSLRDLGKSVKVLSVISDSLTTYYFDQIGSPNVRDNNISGVYITENGQRVNIFSGDLVEGVERFKVSKESLSDIREPREFRVFINREINLIYRYLLPSVK